MTRRLLEAFAGGLIAASMFLPAAVAAPAFADPPDAGWTPYDVPPRPGQEPWCEWELQVGVPSPNFPGEVWGFCEDGQHPRYGRGYQTGQRYR